ncbi:MAG: SUMF1/EgtB/PvdO family nonheme iron enzyme, partial [Paludibacteraceae bacterium]|nr:SUMF1/EgtB/PvdO family nonheme iron enzyme [Paludibacteraceae bacterium]
GRYPITRKEWFEIYPKKDDGKGKLYRPITNVSWYDAVDYCNDRSVKEGLEPYYPRYTCNHKANGYRLPTEAEWEYAAKGGKDGAKDNFIYSGSNDSNEVAWHSENSKGRVHRVGKKKPNQLGLYDMSGNVWEWCWDKYTSGLYRVFRGGGWYDVPAYARVDNRGIKGLAGIGGNSLGFRVVRNAE